MAQGRAYHHRGGDCAVAGDFGALDNITFEEQFNALFVAQDAHGAVRQTLVLDALASCLKTARKRAIVTRMSLAVLRAKPRWTEFAELVEHFTQMRVVPELGAMHSTNTSALEPRRNVVGVALELLVPGTPRELSLWAMTLLAQWYRAVDTEWKKCIDGAVQRSISQSAWPAALTVLSTLLDSLPEDVRKPLISVVLPTLADRLVDDPPAHPCLSLTDFLDKVSQLYPPFFHKPLFSCAASNKDFTVMNHPCAITAISRFLPDFWTRDAEMMSVALLSSSKANAPANGEPVWGAARPGQSVLLGEIIGGIQAVLRTKDMSSAPDNAYVDILKFVIILETRLGLLLDVKPGPAVAAAAVHDAFPQDQALDAIAQSLNDDSDLEIVDAGAQIQGLYAAARDNVGFSHLKNRGTMIMSAAYDGAFNPNPTVRLLGKSKLAQDVDCKACKAGELDASPSSLIPATSPNHIIQHPIPHDIGMDIVAHPQPFTAPESSPNRLKSRHPPSSPTFPLIPRYRILVSLRAQNTVRETPESFSSSAALIQALHSQLEVFDSAAQTSADSTSPILVFHGEWHAYHQRDVSPRILAGAVKNNIEAACGVHFRVRSN
ncbi:hypothetical protein B0H17DRAFT_1130650 [Mycena rosella]|uniref:Uncharacterized protein n=1 Tax=Mycena rosella TaxID=1033263 RepID=A0AAD7DQ24_MYCRO|nr:hypothetical protein B0H17DRAFT_1130650 [Mycena rosella]